MKICIHCIITDLHAAFVDWRGFELLVEEKNPSECVLEHISSAVPY